jgi:thiol-disulfide isomerase/thioredoxin
MFWVVLMGGLGACSGGGSADDTEVTDDAGDDDDDDDGTVDTTDSEPADSDGDGLTDEEEAALGLDPQLADTDGDGLDDATEAADDSLDALNADTDGDGYLDGDEVAEGSDPTDSESLIYKGGWPYVSDKSAIEPGTTSVATDGERVMPYVARDQFGDDVDLYDFYNDDKYIVVDVSAQWCPPCQMVASWLDGHEPSLDADWQKVREAVDSGDVHWVTFLGENNSGAEPGPLDIKDWYFDFPHPNIPVLGDPAYTMTNYVQLAGWPTIIVLNPDLTVAYQPKGFDSGWWDSMDWLNDQL